MFIHKSIFMYFRTKKVSSEEVVRVYIERCKEVNGLINAIVEDRYDDAIKDAKAVDDMIEKCTDLAKMKITQPFLGVPFTTKESNRAKGKMISLQYFEFLVYKYLRKDLRSTSANIVSLP